MSTASKVVGHFFGEGPQKMENQKTSLNIFLGDTKPSLLPFSGDHSSSHPFTHLPIYKRRNRPSQCSFADHVTLSMSLLSESTLYTDGLDYVRAPIDLEFREKKKSFSNML